MKKVKRKILVKKADMYFSQYIRQRAADKLGLVKCVTCENVNTIKKMQNGHFISRQKYATRWSELNCAPQCYGCNIMQQGQQFKFSIYIDEKYGEGTALALLKKSERQKVKFSDQELIDLADKYKKQTK